MAAPTPSRSRSGKLRSLLHLHERQRPEIGIPDYLCDGYMLSCNPVLRNIRRTVIEAGYRFSASELSEYHAWPLMGLRYILDRKLIPYQDTVSLLRQIEKQSPGRFTIQDLETLTRPAPSALLHESAHVLAELALKRRREELEPIRRAAGQEAAVFEVMLGESIANACEAFASIHGRTRLQSFLLQRFHSQVSVSEAGASAIRRTAATFGNHAAFQILVAAYLHYNFLYKRVDLQDIHKTLDAVGVSAKTTTKQRKDISEMFGLALEMNPMARTYTAFSYQYFMGISDAKSMPEFIEVLDFDFLDRYLSAAPYRGVLRDVANMALGRNRRAQYKA